MRIIPAIDIIDGKCVRLTQGDYARKKVYNENPAEIARSFEDAGLEYLHLVDLDGAKAGKVVNWKAIESVTAKSALKVDFGGGIKTGEEIKALLGAGVNQVNLGSIAVRDPGLVESWIELYGSEKIILSADVKGEQVAISGWLENSGMTVFDLVADYVRKGIQYVTCTDISVDGMLQGPNIGLYKKLLAAFPTIKLIASGGVSGLKDLEQLKEISVDGVIIGKAIYEGRIRLGEIGSR